jgi:hypothetical protein
MTKKTRSIWDVPLSDPGEREIDGWDMFQDAIESDAATRSSGRNRLTVLRDRVRREGHVVKVGSLDADIEKVGCAVLHSSHAHVVPSLLGRRRGDSSIGRTSKLVDESAHDLVEAVVEWSVGGAVGPARL